jgi:uncharacterized membrane protein YeiB
MDAPSPQSKRRRIEGYDLARGLAIWGMVTVHFRLVMAFHARQPAWLHSAVEMLDGRAAALFVILAGIGVALRTAKNSSRGAPALPEIADQPVSVSVSDRRLLTRRGMFLLVAGFVNLTVWEGDILRVYGVSLTVAALLLDVSDRMLLIAAGSFLAGFLLLMSVADYNAEWEWATFTYNHLWTVRGAIRNLFFNGFRSVFPWTGLLLFGFWLGRQLLADRLSRKRLFGWSLCIASTTEIVSALVVSYLRRHPTGLDDTDIVALFGTGSMPPLPAFLLAAGSTAVAVIAASLFIAERYPTALPVRALVACGQMAFTWYVFHIVFGLGTLMKLGIVDNQTLGRAVTLAAGFFVVICLISLAVRATGRRGPLEALLRKVAG